MDIEEDIPPLCSWKRHNRPLQFPRAIVPSSTCFQIGTPPLPRESFTPPSCGFRSCERHLFPLTHPRSYFSPMMNVLLGPMDSVVLLPPICAVIYRLA
ncbi:hypothetical protein AVEN_87085-1 [Araneus ventricosus]|uniref:Uncharacterized protein n=1 Tax=Araneus ventricosus TaxID=182803 RepID=A0A4Y2U3B5_ARAVE|nr:hypothetical protein AVEN_87085-1 [Araneus ventricosus]